jgi:hypothetical protein
MRFGEIEPSLRKHPTAYRLFYREDPCYFSFDDTGTIIPALRGILMLARLPSYLSNNATTMLRVYVFNGQTLADQNFRMSSHVKMKPMNNLRGFLYSQS